MGMRNWLFGSRKKESIPEELALREPTREELVPRELVPRELVYPPAVYLPQQRPILPTDDDKHHWEEMREKMNKRLERERIKRSRYGG